MRVEQPQVKKGSKGGLLGALMGLVLLGGVLLSMEKAPARHATFSVEAAKSEAAELSSTTPQSISPDDASADSSVLDLQLD